MPAFRPTLALALLLPLAAHAAEPRLSSNTDYSAPGARDLPVTCKPGDAQPFAGKTMGEVFGEAWPATPAATASHTPPKVLTRSKLVPPRGLEGKPATVVVAVLVGADGKGLAEEAVCMSDAAFATAAKRVLRNSTYEPARVDGQAVTSVLAVPIVFRPGKRGGGSEGGGGGGNSDQE